VGVWATGASAEELLEALGLGVFSLMTDLRRVRPRSERTVRASAADPAGLVVAFLNALLVAHSDDGFLARRISARTGGSPPTSVTARVVGESFSSDRHPARTEVKAATFHGLVFDPTRGRARVIVDI